MAGFETIVRPSVLPGLRPRPKQSLPPEADPEKGIAVIRGNPAKTYGVNYSLSVSGSKSRQKENRREVDTARIYQMDDDGEINRDNFVDVEVAQTIWMDETGPGTSSHYNEDNPDPESKPDPAPRIQIEQQYAPVQTAPNIEIIDMHKMILNPENKNAGKK